MHQCAVEALARVRWPHVEIETPVLDEVVPRLANDIAARLRRAISQRGQAVLCVSGGKSPIALFEALRALPVAWADVTVTLVDERCVPADHADSNALLVRTHLLQGAAAQARFAPLFEHAPDTPGDAARHANGIVAALPVPDVLVLGMGSDGHTASLFPGSPDLAHALDLNNTDRVCALRLPASPPVQPNHPRLTLTLAQILRARHIILPVQGADKLSTLAMAARELTAPTLASLPVSHVLHQATTPVSLWLPS